jgi:SynChlorMet cassette protein ScmC
VTGGLAFHAGLVEYNGKGYLLAGPGDTGKSTCCRRIPSSWRALCDDESLAVVDPNGMYRTHPFPTWSDYILRNSDNSWDVQYSVPLAGIFFLEQAETDDIRPLRDAEAAALINNAAVQVWNKFLLRSDISSKRYFKLKLFDNACKMAKKVPSYLLSVSLTGSFWEKMEQVVTPN